MIQIDIHLIQFGRYFDGHSFTKQSQASTKEDTTLP